MLKKKSSYQRIFQIIVAQPICQKKHQLAPKRLISMHVPHILKLQNILNKTSKTGVTLLLEF